jgi:hypothetical protein
MNILKRGKFLYTFYISFFAALLQLSFAQSVPPAPLSRFGLGDEGRAGTVRNLAMGGTGIATNETNLISILNPASLGGSRLTLVDGSIRYQARSVSIGEASQFNRSGNIGYLFASVPVSPTWNTVLGFNSGGEVSYEYFDRIPIVGTPNFTIREISGEGNLNNLNLINGFKVNKKLKIGLEAKYTFGSLFYVDTYRADIPGNSLLKTSIVMRNRYNLLTLRTGVLYSIPLTGVVPRVFNIGLTVDGGASLQTKQFKVSEQVSVRDNFFADLNDTISFREGAQVQLAPRIGLGLSYQKEGSYILSMDVFHQQWSRYRNDLRPETFKNTVGIALGASWVPSISGNLFKRTAYRIGFHAEQKPIVIDNQRVNDLGISFGLSLPVDKTSKLNVSAIFGRRGANSTIPIFEEYIQINLGYSITDRWFVRFRED